MKQSFHKQRTENLVNTKVQWLNQLRNSEPAPSDVCHLETTCQRPIQNKLLCCIWKRHKMCLGQISWIVRQNLSMLPLHTSLSGLVTGVWRPLCAAFRLTEWQRPEDYCLRDYRHTEPPALSQCIYGIPSYVLELSDAFKRHFISK